MNITVHNGKDVKLINIHTMLLYTHMCVHSKVGQYFNSITILQ